ncbi:UNVERIFIED_CONTAM: hypothetical protein Scaly_2733600 [Sesamum calycinum]|uniref:Uncharacterized protein n=1 Tax=Sesamum calycinum TaxID=2727403 RepID=A0AAW2J1U1_9LAMI
MLNDSNFKLWIENLKIVLGVMDLDLALREDSPPTLIDKSTSKQKREKQRWEKSNRMCVMIMKKSIPEAFRGTMSETLTKAKDFLQHIEKRFVKNEKIEIGILLTNLLFKKKKIWSLNELISYCVQEDERLKQDKTERAYFASTSKGKNKGKKRKKNNGAADTALQKKQPKESNDSKSGNAQFFENVGFVDGDKVKDIIEEEYVDIPMGTIDIVQDLVPNSVDEIKSMKDNDVRELVQLPQGVKPIGCK